MPNVSVLDSVSVSESAPLNRNLGTALSFNGTNASVTRACPTSATNNITFGCWIKITSKPSSTVGIISVGDNFGSAGGYQIVLNSAMNINFNPSNQNPLTNSTVLSLNTWYHVAVTMINRGWQIYINGIQSGPVGFWSVNPVNYFAIGATNGHASPVSFFTGYIDDVRLYERCLNPVEVYNWANGRITGNQLTTDVDTTNLVVWYKFDEGSGSTATDSSGNGLDATINNATYVTDSAGPPLATAPQKILIQDVMHHPRRAGTYFTLDGAVWSPFGAAIYASTNEESSLDARVADAVTMGFTILRIVNFLSVTSTLGSEFNESTWQLVDYLLWKAHLSGIRVLIDCSDFCAGLLFNRGIPIEQQDWSAFVSFLMNRVNTFNGRVYKDDDAIGMITIVGELPDASRANTPILINNVLTLLKAAGSQQLIGIGAIEYYDPSIQYTAKVPNLDYLGSHTYFNTNNIMDYNFNLHRALANVSNTCWILEEFGSSVNVGDTAMAAYFQATYEMGLKYNIAGFLYWNMARTTPQPTTSTDDNVGPTPVGNQPQTVAMIQSYASSIVSRVTANNAVVTNPKQINMIGQGYVQGVRVR